MLNTDHTGTLSSILREALSAGETARLTTATDSMWPMIRPGDTVVARGIDTEGLHAGDIVLYEKGRHLCIHRLLRKELINGESILATKGDNSLQMDSPLLTEQVLGRVVAIEKRLYNINLQQPWWQAANKILAIFSLIEAMFIKTMKGAINVLS